MQSTDNALFLNIPTYDLCTLLYCSNEVIFLITSLPGKPNNLFKNKSITLGLN